jgi:predicted nucleotidyltransferase component of viral defense system
MNDVIALSSNERREVFTETGVRLGMAPFHVEKDFWVCWTLVALFTDDRIGPNLVFRGGTSLSKGWGLIQRFSEDIDLAINRSWVEQDLKAEASFSNVSKSQQERRLKSLRKKCREVSAS